MTMDLFYPAIPPILAIIIALFFNMESIVRMNVKAACHGKMEEADVMFVEIIVKGALALETLVISVFSTSLTLVLLAFSWWQHGKSKANIQLIWLGLILCILVANLAMVYFVRSKDYRKVGSDLVSALERLICLCRGGE